jgi:SAM-dependent methyltransferase
MSTQVTPDSILQIGFGFWASKTLLSAVEIDVFSTLAAGPLRFEELQSRLVLHPRSARDFLDALVALKLLDRTDTDTYRNTDGADLYLDRAKPTYIGGILEMANKRLYPFWGRLTEALRTGEMQNEAKGGIDPFAAIYADPATLENFLGAMTGISRPAAQAIARQFPWRDYKSFVDIGCAQGAAGVALCRQHPHLTGIGFDLQPVQPVFEKFVRAEGLNDRLSFKAGSFFEDPLPAADVLIMGHILHDWGLDTKMMLLEKAHAALSKGGVVLVYDAIIDDERRENAMGLLMSLNMLIETHDGFDYTGPDCRGWMHKAGFRDVHVERLPGADSMVIGIK